MLTFTNVFKAVLALLDGSVAVAVLYRVISMWLTGTGFDSMGNIANALNALVVFLALGLLHAVAAQYSPAPAVKSPES